MGDAFPLTLPVTDTANALAPRLPASMPFRRRHTLCVGSSVGDNTFYWLPIAADDHSLLTTVSAALLPLLCTDVC